ncbi:Flagellar basal body-associated protein FliL [Pseudovibrio axinellae]|uniref:Flagellar protein FliL n=1 Tax=Pseudovibrio axinellae TaxID=989403 RepID=A0A165TY46_9HYPH|nr:flagellar basal body-associated FliL family protein [Pseudovibrio axinellae]KZL08451.1 Flagellar basal body-associated protein FliL [Pseudovibrio axinellae]SEP74246.1 flagellar FliL protein [Pseudovibrio axinellae]
MALKPQLPSSDNAWAGIVIAAAIVTTCAGLGGMAMGSALVDQVHSKYLDEQKASSGALINPEYTESSQIVSLKPIVTNLLSSSKNWIRIEASVVLMQRGIEEQDHSLLVKQVEQDLLLYARTLGPRQLEGTRGLLRLRDDLNERAKMRGGNFVKELVLESVVIQ